MPRLIPGTPLYKARQELRSRLLKLNPDTLAVSDYYKGYLRRILDDREYYLDLYADHLYYATMQHNDLRDAVVVDYGCGCGLLAVMAKLAGAYKVVAVDIFEDSIEDAKVIARELGRSADHYLVGDAAYLRDWLREHQLRISCLVGMDVVEHIYNLPEFFMMLKHVAAPDMEICLGTGSNPYNSRKSKELEAVQIKLEKEGAHSGKSRDSKEPYFAMRRHYLESWTQAAPNKLDEMAALTRGLVYRDMPYAVSCFNEGKRDVDINGTLYPLHHPTNTCDPATGNWAERLLPAEQYRDWLKEQGMEFTWYNGRYNTYSPSALKNAAAGLVNLFISERSALSRRWSPYAYLRGYQPA